MMDPKQLFDELLSQVGSLAELALTQESMGETDSRSSIYRACIVLSVSALDTYMHEKTAATFILCAQQGPVTVKESIASYLQVPVHTLDQPQWPSSVRYWLSFKTLVAPHAIDNAINASGRDPKNVWRAIGEARGSRESRLRNMLDLQVDRRNQIAHEADWDPAQLAFRRISADHVKDCTDCIRDVVHSLDACWL